MSTNPMYRAEECTKDNVKSVAESAMNAGKGVFANGSNWVPRSFPSAGKRIKLAPTTGTPLGVDRAESTNAGFFDHRKQMNEDAHGTKGLQLVRFLKENASFCAMRFPNCRDALLVRQSGTNTKDGPSFPNSSTMRDRFRTTCIRWKKMPF